MKMQSSQSKASSYTCDQAEALKELHLLCQQGRLFEVEEWIQQGNILQLAPDPARRSRHRSALEIALFTLN